MATAIYAGTAVCTSAAVRVDNITDKKHQHMDAENVFKNAGSDLNVEFSYHQTCSAARWQPTAALKSELGLDALNRRDRGTVH